MIDICNITNTHISIINLYLFLKTFMITPLARNLFAKRIAEINNYAKNAEQIQREQLNNLITQAISTEFGKDKQFNKINSAEEFAKRLPIFTYETIQPYIEKMVKGEKDILWKGRVKYFAQSSGTTDAKSKYIPVSDESFKTMHFRGGIDSVAMYLYLNPESRFFKGKSMVIGAGKSSKNEYGSHIGLLSGLLSECGNPLVGLLREPSLDICMMPDFTDKMEKMLPKIVKKNIVSISGIPSWYQIFLYRMLEYTGKKYVTDIWPNLEVFFHGGVSFEPYKELFKSMIPSEKMHYLEVFNASEGFFSIQNDFNDPSMLLMLDYGTFYEFVPLENIHDEQPVAMPLWQVEKGKSYALIISNNSGLWRYNIGDVVTFTSVKPYKFIISGRTKHFLNLCGEEVMVGNADAAIAKASDLTGAKVLNYTATVVCATPEQKARHQWMIEFDQMPNDLNKFIEILDNTLIEVNSDYESKRTKSIALEIPDVIVARKNLFTDWMKKSGKTAAQQKIPRLLQKRDLMEQLIEMNY